ncbi:MAG: 50S ribosomal protein L11 methyltransferase [Rhodospirillales bacterium]|nr:50S ribosomal protein L11 methyltransferase [Rhodospirillales bacterium]
MVGLKPRPKFTDDLPKFLIFKAKTCRTGIGWRIPIDNFHLFSRAVFIYGAHYNSGVPDGQMGLQIDAATAFGSGEHGTTKGCLQAMLDLKGQGACPWNVLDMGTGSGILALQHGNSGKRRFSRG